MWEVRKIGTVSERKKRKAIFYMVTTEMTLEEIAKQININPTSIAEWKKEESFREMHREYVTMFLADHSSKALKTMISLLDSKDEGIQFKASKDILDRAGLREAEKLDLNESVEIRIVGKDKNEIESE